MIHPAVNIPGQELADLCRRNAVRQLALFGSATREDFSPEASDVDMLVEFEAGAAFDLFGFKALREGLERLVRRKVALASKRRLNRIIRDEVLSGREVLHAQ